MARRLVVMEGGHPWGFRIEGGQEVQQPIRINKVLDGGKACCHGIREGDILSSINGENAIRMTISRARHLVRTSDNLLVLEVTRPSKEFAKIPEIRVISPSENRNTYRWGTNEASGYERYGERYGDSVSVSASTSSDRVMSPNQVGMRSTVLSSKQATSSMPQVRASGCPPPVMKKPQVHFDRQKQVPLQHLLPSSPPSIQRQNPVEFTSRVRPGTSLGFSNEALSNQVHRELWQDARNSSSSQQGLRNHNLPPNWTFTRPGFENPVQKSNTEPAPIGQRGQRGEILAVRPTVEGQPAGFRIRDQADARQFRTVNAGTADRSLSSTAVVLPLTTTFKGPAYKVSENQYGPEYQRAMLKNELDRRFASQGHSKSSAVRSQNHRNIGSPVIMLHHEKSWPKKIEEYEAECRSPTFQKESMMYPDYDLLPEKQLQHNNIGFNNPKGQSIVVNHAMERGRVLPRDALLRPGFQFDRRLTRQKLDEENLRRKLEIEKVLAEERERRYIKDQIANEARRHSDYFNPLQRSPIILDRFSDDEVAETLARPLRRVNTKIRGKARALYTFRAQNSRELSFRRNDIIFLLRQVDKNWFQGERHGTVGIFPISYVEVLTSLDEAQAIAELRHGTATATYNFKAQTEYELPLRKGDTVVLIRRVDENWYEGKLGRRQGIFPVSYVATHREPDTPMATPMSSLAPTPVPGTPKCYSPASSLFSVGPDIPSAPMSPLDSDFYESDWETLSQGALQTGHSLRTSRPTSPGTSCLSDRETTPVISSSPAPIIPRDNNRAFSEASKTQNPASAPMSYSQFSDITMKKEAALDQTAVVKDTNKPNNLAKNVLPKTTSSAVDNRPPASDAAKQRPPSGRLSLGSPALKVSKQKPPVKQPLVENRDQRDGVSKAPRTPNPYSRYRAIYNYKPQNLDELELTRGDIVYVMEKCDDGWFVGISDKTKQFGTFPGNFVRSI